MWYTVFGDLENPNIVVGIASLVVECREILLLPVSIAIFLHQIEIDVQFVAAHRVNIMIDYKFTTTRNFAVMIRLL